MKNRISNVVLVLVFLTGLSLLLYPTVSDWWNSYHSSQAIVDYTTIVARIDDNRYDEIWQSAKEYNSSLVNRPYRWTLTEKEKTDYYTQLDVSSTGIIGHIEIPSINCTLPIYHGTDEDVLAVGVGHMEGSSLPTGGESTHCALSGHRGLPSAKLFTDLDRLVEGDIFLLKVLDEVLTYEIDQILIVLPEEMESLEIIPGADLCTLVTCTPYGINSHRLLVRGHRVETTQTAIVRLTGDAMQIDPVVIATLISIPLIAVLTMTLFIIPAPKGGFYEE